MKYFAKKTLTLIITLFMISIATFFVFQIIPGDAVANMLGTEAHLSVKKRSDSSLDWMSRFL